MIKCKTCNGAGKVKSKCITCDNKGYSSISLYGAIDLTSYYACHDCGNLRCVTCGGEGITPAPSSIKLR